MQKPDKEYFGKTKYMVSLATRDMDLFIPRPTTIKAKTDVVELLKDFGFVVGFTGSKGYIRLEHPANFALHKLLVLSRRKSSEKQAKDKQTAVRILTALINKGQSDYRTGSILLLQNFCFGGKRRPFDGKWLCFMRHKSYNDARNRVSNYFI